MGATPISVGPVVLGFNAAIQAIAGSYATGDAILVCYGEFLGAATISAPAGWTDVGDAVGAIQGRVFGLIAPSNSVTLPTIQFGADKEFCYAVVYRGLSLNPAFPAKGRQTNTTQNIAGPSSILTPSGPNVTFFFGNRNKTATANGNTFSAPAFSGSGFQVIQQHAQSGTGTSSVLCAWIQNTPVAIPANITAAGVKVESVAQTQVGLLFSLLAATAPGPTFTSAPATASVSATTATFNATLDQTCTEYAVAVAAASTQPSIAQIKAGQNASGSAAVASANVSATAAQPVALTLTGLTSGTAYDVYFVGNDSNGDTVVKSVLGLTTAVTSTITASISSVTADGYVLSYSPGATGTVWVVALLKGSPSLVGTASAVESGTPSGFLGRFSKAATNGTPSTITLTGLTLPKADLYLVLDASGVFSVVIPFLDALKGPASGRQYCGFGTLSSSSPFNQISAGGVFPQIHAGDILDIPLVSPTGYTITPTSSGDFIVDARFDVSRELVPFNIYDDSLQAMYFTSDSLVSINNAAPKVTTADPQTAFSFIQPAGAVVNVDLTAAAIADADGDPLTFAESAAFAGTLASIGLSIAPDGTHLVGTLPNANGFLTLGFTVRDPYGASTDIQGFLFYGQQQIPTGLSGKLEAAADLLVIAANFFPQSVLVESTDPPGTVVEVTPPEGSFAAPFSTIILSIATPPASPGGGSGGQGGGGSGPVVSPTQTVSRDASVQLVVSDVFHYFGGDVSLSNTQDLLTVSEGLMGQQRILRRLLTNPGAVLSDPSYGAGLPQAIGQPIDIAKITAVILSGMMLEAVVAKTPTPTVTVTQADNDPSTINVVIVYWDANLKQKQVLDFNVSPLQTN